MTAPQKRVFVWDDKSTWPSVMESIDSDYTHVRGYHCCRPLDVNSYYTDGLLLPSKEELLHRTLYLLHNANYSEDILVERFNEVWEAYHSEATVITTIYFGICKEFLVEQCGHYLIYGSELICAVARRLHIESVLKKQGKPTIFSIDIPMSQIDEQTVSALKARMKENRRYKKPSIDFSIFINHPLPSDLIVSHEHPHRVPDPFYWGTYYRLTDS